MKAQPVQLVLDYQPGIDESPPCALCGGPGETFPGWYGVAVAGGGRVCEDCAQMHSPSEAAGQSVWSLAEGLSAVAAALVWAADSPGRQRGALGAVHGAVDQLADTFGLAER